MAGCHGDVEFLYCEEHRLALEELLGGGEHCYHNFITTNRVQPFLSGLELAQLASSVEPYCPASPDVFSGFNGAHDGTRVSLQYWPERSDCTLPQLDLGWPSRALYRGVTRVSVHAQPPLHGHAHIKEIVRKMIARARKVIAVVMDLFTDVDIFKDLLHASFKRKVAVYIILEATGVPHFLHMCERTAMHTGHLKNLRVRSSRGNEFLTRTSKKVCGTQSQKFMFVDGDQALSGSYSFTWSASRLDRSISTELTGQAVEFFDFLFQDLYVMSNAVNLNQIKLENEPRQEPISKPSPTLPLPSDIIALKLNNPKYALVCGNGAVSSNFLSSEQCTAKTDCTEQMKGASEIPHGHPGLLNIEKVNMIDYLPVWPNPDIPSNVTECIITKDNKEPLHDHFVRSVLFEGSQAIRLKGPAELPHKPLSERSHLESRLKSSSPSAASANEQPHIQSLAGIENRYRPYKEHSPPPSSPKEVDVLLLSIANPKTPHNSNKHMNDSPVDHGDLGLIAHLTEQRNDLHDCTNSSETNCTENTSNEQGGVNHQVNHGTSCSIKTNSRIAHTLSRHFETTSVHQLFERTSEPISNKRLEDDEKWKDLVSDNNDCYESETPSSEAYFEFIDPYVTDSDGIVTRIPLGFKLFEMDLPPDTDAHSLTSLTAEFQEIDLDTGSREHTPSHQSITGPQLQTRSPRPSNMQYAHLIHEAESLSEIDCTYYLEETLDIYVPSPNGPKTKPLSIPDVHEAHNETASKKHELQLDPVINHSDLNSIDICGSDNTQMSVLHVLKVAEAQCIVFSEGSILEPKAFLN